MFRRNAFAACLLVACSAPESATFAGGGPPANPVVVNPPAIGITRFCDQQLEVMAATTERCTGAVPDGYRRSWPLQQRAWCAFAERSREAGRITFNAGDAERCLTAIEGAACADLHPPFSGSSPWRPGGPCDLAFEGRVALQGSCVHDTECRADAYCSLSGDGCGGTCASRVAPGGVCQPGSESCRAGSVCAGEPDDPRCVLSRPRAGEGAPCSVSEGAHCLFGFYCETPDGAEVGVCRRQRTNGACDDATVCAPKYHCSRAGEGQGVCRAQRGPGQTCGHRSQECVQFTFCSADERCELWRGVGGQCGMLEGNEYAGCLESFCDIPEGATLGSCQPFLAEGAPCRPDGMGDQCGYSGFCDRATSRCRLHCWARHDERP
jgi:hypothetical protein